MRAFAESFSGFSCGLFGINTRLKSFICSPFWVSAPASGTCVGCSVTKTSVLSGTCLASYGRFLKYGYPKSPIFIHLMIWKSPIWETRKPHFFLSFENRKKNKKNISPRSHRPHWAPTVGCWCCAPCGFSFPSLSWYLLLQLQLHWLPLWHPQRPSAAPAKCETHGGFMGVLPPKWMAYEKVDF